MLHAFAFNLMKIIYTNHFPPGRYVAINLFGVVFARRKLSGTAIRHESIHTAQMRELWYIGFYIWYVAEFILRLFQRKSWYKAYRAVSFEREAYAYEKKAGYLVLRHPFTWFEYM